MDALQPIKRLFNSSNILDRLESVENASGVQPSMSMDTLDEVATRTGELIVDRLICPAPDVEDTDPTSSNFTGSFIDGSGIGFGGNLYHIGGVDRGVLRFGISSTNGSAYFLGGNAVIDEGGIQISQNALAFIQNISVGTEYRVGRLGSKGLPGQSVPGFGMEFYEPSSSANLLTNGDFASDLSSWTTSNAEWVATLFSQSGVAQHDGTAGSLSVYQSIAVTAGLLYYVEAKLYCAPASGSGGSASFSISFYDVSANPLSTTYIAQEITSPFGFTTYSGFAIAPPTATSAIVSIISVYPSAVDDVVVRQITFANQIIFHPETGDITSLSENYSLARIPRSLAQLTNHMGANPTTAVSAGGSLLASTVYNYKFYARDRSGVCGVASGITEPNCTATTTVANKTITISGIKYPPGVTSWDIYRQEVVGLSPYIFLATTSATSYVDNGSISPPAGVFAPYTNTTAERPFSPPFSEINAARGIQTVGSGGRSLSSGATPAAYFVIASTGNSNDGDSEEFGIWINAGTYQITEIGPTSATSGKTDWYIDDVSIATGLDHYSASTVHYVTKTVVASVAIATSGYHILKWKINGKNASSADYVFGLSYMMIYPASSY